MPAFTPVDRVVERLNVTVEKLWDFQGFGWISIVEKDGTLFIPEHQEYKAVLILRLQRVLWWWTTPVTCLSWESISIPCTIRSARAC